MVGQHAITRKSHFKRARQNGGVSFRFPLEKAATAGEIDASLNPGSVALWLYALVDGLIARAADDSEFDFTKHIAVFETLVRRALQPCLENMENKYEQVQDHRAEKDL